MSYLVDSNVLITPFSTPSLHTLRVVWGYPSSEQVAERLKNWFTTAFVKGYLVGLPELADEVQRKKDRASQFVRELLDQEFTSTFWSRSSRNR